MRLIVGLLGASLVVLTVVSAIKSFILPRGIDVWLTSAVFRFVGLFFLARVRRATFDERDRIMALFAPLTLFLMPIVMLVLILLGYMCLYWAFGIDSIYETFRLSGSSLLTLGYASQDTPLFKVLEFSEATLGLILIALLIAYLPSMYSAFSRRETNVALLEGRAGSPPSALEFIARSHRTNELTELREVWIDWQSWFAELEESHTSLAPLSFFRSQKPDRSWITAAGVLLDTAAIILSSVDVPFEPRAAFCIRSGFLALRHIADFFDIPYPPNPTADYPISISQSEFDTLYNKLASRGVPMKADQAQAWRDFKGWRVNYDIVLLSLATLTMAPYTEWVSDRSAIPCKPQT